MGKLPKKDICGNDRWSSGRIDPDTSWGKEFGFTSDKFSGWLWKKGHWIIVSFIESKEPGHGHFKHLIQTIKKFHFDVAVPTPMAQMEIILKKWEWKPSYVGDIKFGLVELWTEKGSVPDYLAYDD